MIRFLTTLMFLIVVFFNTSLAFAQSQGDVNNSVTGSSSAARYATCDLCGFCTNGQDPANWQPAPDGWAKCSVCLYPEASTDALSGDTVRINEADNSAPTPMPGRHHTMFGCIKTDVGDFSQTGAASSFVQILLNTVFAISGGIAMLYIIYGAFVIITSQAEPERLAYGKRLVWGAIVGLILVLSSVFIVNFIASGVLRLPGFTGNQ